MQYKKMAAIFGAIIFAAFTAFFVTIIWLAESRIFFTRDYIIYMKFKDVSGLKRMSPVYMRGYRVGWVKGVEFEKDWVKVRTDINRNYRVPKGSKAEIFALNILGEKAIRIVPPSPPYREFYENRDEMVGENKDIMVQAQKLLEKLKKPLDEHFEPTINEVHSIISNIRKLLVTVRHEVANTKIRENVEKVGKAADEYRALAEENRAGIKITVEEMQKNLRNMQETLDELKRTSAELRKALTTLNSGQGTAGRLLKDRKTLDELDKTLEELNRLIADIRKNPKKYFKFSIF